MMNYGLYARVYLLGCRAPPPTWAASGGAEDHNSEVKLLELDTGIK